jgi:hypothetical protein
MGGGSERRNQTLLDLVRSMINQTGLPLSLWGYALEAAVSILNIVRTKSVEKTPYLISNGKHPGMSFLKVWGCETYIKCFMSDKVTPKLDNCFFVGYPRKTKRYYFYNKSEGKVFVAHNSVFLEKEFLSKGVSGSKVQHKEIRETLENVLGPTKPIHDVQDVVLPIVQEPTP